MRDGLAEAFRSLPHAASGKDDMHPITLAEAEADLIDAYATGSPERIAIAEALVDRLDSPRPLPNPAASALWYAEVAGLRVFPLQAGSKVPWRGSNGCKGATADSEQIRAWWTEAPESNIGIATGHLVDVIDIDGPPGVKTWAEIKDDLPPILGHVSTPRPGGNHLYVAATEGRGNKAGIFPGIDYRGAGGYVVAPPSVIRDGDHPGDYRWIRPLDLAALTTEATPDTAA
jgi:hypothetical protein